MRKKTLPTTIIRFIPKLNFRHQKYLSTIHVTCIANRVPPIQNKPVNGHRKEHTRTKRWQKCDFSIFPIDGCLLDLFLQTLMCLPLHELGIGWALLLLWNREKRRCSEAREKVSAHVRFCRHLNPPACSCTGASCSIRSSTQEWRRKFGKRSMESERKRPNFFRQNLRKTCLPVEWRLLNSENVIVCLFLY